MLDTWFSSALWPFATLGWPEQTEELKRHYPNDVLISGFDIIFFWDARMAMQGFEFMGEKPWKTLYLHGLVRDAQGQKMSKSKGNTVDPLGLIDRYGADALRFTMAAMESQGRDIKLDEKRVEGYRNFATKLWNAARFLQGNGVGGSQSIAAPEAKLPVNRWIIGEVVETLAKLEQGVRRAALRRHGRRHLPFHLGHLLRLVCRAGQRRVGRRDPRRRRLGVRPDPGHAPPVHALRHRGIVARDGGAALRPHPRQMAGARSQGRQGRQGRNRLADPAGQRNPRRRGPSSTSRPAPSLHLFARRGRRCAWPTGSTASTARCRGWPGSNRSSCRTSPERRGAGGRRRGDLCLAAWKA